MIKLDVECFFVGDVVVVVEVGEVLNYDKVDYVNVSEMC